MCHGLVPPGLSAVFQRHVSWGVSSGLAGSVSADPFTPTESPFDSALQEPLILDAATWTGWRSTFQGVGGGGGRDRKLWAEARR